MVNHPNRSKQASAAIKVGDFVERASGEVGIGSKGRVHRIADNYATVHCTDNVTRLMRLDYLRKLEKR